MATSKSSPTAGEISQNDVPDGTTEPTIETIAATEGQEVEFTDAEVAEADGDEAPPVETNFPEAALEAEDGPEAAEDPDADPEPQSGEVWAIYTGQQPSQRILTVEDLRSLGDSRAEEPLVWDRNNRYRRDVASVHPMVLDYIENLDGGFRIVRPE